MSTQHTPGPWHFTHETDAHRARGKFLVVFPVGDPVVVCDVNRHRGPASEANARLIAAAPELLEALNDMLDEFRCDTSYPMGDVRHAAVEAIAKARAALAKAEGSRSQPRSGSRRRSSGPTPGSLTWSRSACARASQRQRMRPWHRYTKDSKSRPRA